MQIKCMAELCSIRGWPKNTITVPHYHVGSLSFKDVKNVLQYYSFSQIFSKFSHTVLYPFQFPSIFVKGFESFPFMYNTIQYSMK